MVEGCQGEVHLGHELAALVEVGRGPGIYLVQGAPRHIPGHIVWTSGQYSCCRPWCSPPEQPDNVVGVPDPLQGLQLPPHVGHGLRHLRHTTQFTPWCLYGTDSKDPGKQAGLTSLLYPHLQPCPGHVEDHLVLGVGEQLVPGVAAVGDLNIRTQRIVLISGPTVSTLRMYPWGHTPSPASLTVK